MLTLIFLLGVFLSHHQTDSQSLVIIGGGLSDSNSEVYGRFLQLAGGASNARIGIVTASSSDPWDSAQYYMDLLENTYGVREAYWIPVHENNKGANSDPNVVTNTQRMTGYFFSGGDQARIIRSFYNNGQESPVLQALKSVYNAGGVVAGSSAGAAVMPNPVMIMGGMSYEALRYGAYRYDDPDVWPDDLIYDADGGIGLLNGYITDTHTGERGREGRLTRLVHDSAREAKSARFGIGPDENTALVITNANRPNAVGEVFGRWGVIIVDLSDVTEVSGQYEELFNVKVHYLTHGDRINLRDHHVIFDTSWKSNLEGNEIYDNAITSSDIFDGTRSGQTIAEFADVSSSVFDARHSTETYGLTRENNPRFRLNFIQTPQSRGFGGYSPLTDEWHISYSNLRMDITHCRSPCSLTENDRSSKQKRQKSSTLHQPDDSISAAAANNE